MPMTLRSSLLRPIFVLALFALVAGSGCARMKGMFKDEDKNEGLPVSQLYDKAHGDMEQGRWSSASETWGRLIAQYPYGPYT
ncbi:MAG TPA: outer membrane protein assembly factor BamD, partial [Thermomonas sp.]|nr:outer membrane protein assembly factor BamD [Thermomonas sp.]